MNDQNTSEEKPEIETEVSPAEGSKASRRWVPASLGTPAATSQLAAAGIAAALFLGGGLGGFAIGQANDGPDHSGLSRPGHDHRGPGGPGGPGGPRG